jgi:uncharacterized protein YjbI with pentapeptide repeats
MTRNDTMISLAVNSWINGNRVVWPDADLRYADLRGANLIGADLSEANLIEANLIGAKITLGNRTLTLTEETDQ